MDRTYLGRPYLELEEVSWDVNFGWESAKAMARGKWWNLRYPRRYPAAVFEKVHSLKVLEDRAA